MTCIRCISHRKMQLKDKVIAEGISFDDFMGYF